jgi:hypothetical protein
MQTCMRKRLAAGYSPFLERMEEMIAGEVV